MDTSQPKLTRGEALKSLIVLPALAAAFVAVQSPADAKMTKAASHYQNHPKGSQKCSGCTLFVKGKNAKANGTCVAVGGSISPNGWCTLYSKK